jgi:hypothetical protein
MANLCDGVSTYHQKTLKNARAYCEGVDWRMGGTAVQRPDTANPEDGVGSEAEAAWDAGYADAAAGTVEGCSAYFGASAAPA